MTAIVLIDEKGTLYWHGHLFSRIPPPSDYVPVVADYVTAKGYAKSHGYTGEIQITTI